MDSITVGFGIISFEAGDLWIIDVDNSQVLHFGYAGVGTMAVGGKGSREVGFINITQTGDIEGWATMGTAEAIAGLGPVFSAGGNYESAYSGSFGVGAGVFVSLGAMRTRTWFKKVYSYDEAPSHIWTY